MKVCLPIVFAMFWPATDAHTFKEKLEKIIVNSFLVNKLNSLKQQSFFSSPQINKCYFPSILLLVHTQLNK